MGRRIHAVICHMGRRIHAVTDMPVIPGHMPWRIHVCHMGRWIPVMRVGLVSKETYYSQKRPTTVKRDLLQSKETYYSHKRPTTWGGGYLSCELDLAIEDGEAGACLLCAPLPAVLLSTSLPSSLPPSLPPSLPLTSLSALLSSSAFLSALFRSSSLSRLSV